MEEKNKPDFDFKKFEEAALEQLRSGKKLEGKDGILTPLAVVGVFTNNRA